MTVERRPPPVTLACALAGFVGFMVMLNLIDVLSSWGSIELQESVESALENELLAGRDISLATALSTLRVAAQVLLLASIALLVFAIFTVRGDRASRWGLTVLSGTGAILLTTIGGFGELLPAILLASCVFVLWSPEARVWFDVRNGRTPSPALVARAEARVRRRTMDATEGSGAGGAAGTPGPGAAGATGPATVHPSGPQSAPQGVPGGVLSAAITMLVCSLLVGTSTGLAAALVAVRQLSPEAFDRFAAPSPQLQEAVSQLDAGGGTVSVVTLVVLVLLTVVAGLGALVALGLLMNRRRAYLPALVLAWVTGVGAAVAFPVGLLVTVPALATIVLLRRTDSRAWARR